MRVAFSATLHLVFGDKKVWVLIAIAASAWIPVSSFTTLQFPSARGDDQFHVRPQNLQEAKQTSFVLMQLDEFLFSSI